MTYYQLTVQHTELRLDRLKLTFVDANVRDDAQHELRRKGFDILDVSPGFKIYDTCQEAVEAAEFWKR